MIERRVGKSGVRWRVRVFHQGRVVATRTFLQKSVAQEWHAQQVTALRAGISIVGAQEPVEVWAQRWQQSRPRRAASTVRLQDQLLRDYVLPEWEAVPVRDVRASAVRAWGQRLERERSSSTARKAIGVLRQVLQLAVEDLAISSNPAANVGFSTVSKNKPVALSHGQVWALADAMPSLWRPVVLLGAYGGLRAQEMAALNCADFDPDSRLVHVTKSYALTGKSGSSRALAPTKTHQSRVVPVPASVADVLGSVWDGRPGGQPLFYFDQYPDNRLRGDRFRELLVATSEQLAGCPRVTPHNLRDTCASLAILSGATLSEVSRLLGHESTAVTARHYITFFPSELVRVANQLDVGIKNRGMEQRN